MATENHTPAKQPVKSTETLFHHRLTPSSGLREGEPFNHFELYEAVSEYMRRIQALADLITCASLSRLEPAKNTIPTSCNEIEGIAMDCQAVLDLWRNTPATQNRLKSSAAEISNATSGETETPEQDNEEREALLESIRDNTEEMGIAVHKALGYFEALKEPGMAEYELRTVLRGADQLNDEIIGAATDLARGPAEDEQEMQA